MKTVLKNAHLVSSKETIDGDLLIEDGKIAKVGGAINAPGAQEFDCTGKFIMPGVIDAHVHFRSPGYEYKEDWDTGSRAAATGGVTTVFDMPNTNPHTTTVQALEEKRALASAKSHVNFGFFMGGNGKNVDEINKAKGIVGVKVYMGETTGQKVEGGSGFMEMILQDLFEKTGKVIAIHAEDEDLIKNHIKTYEHEDKPEIHSLIRNDSIAFAAVRQAVHLAKKYSGKLHICHMSTKKEVELLAKYPDENITCEVTPHHLTFTINEYSKQGNFVKMNPPLRSQNDVDALWNAVRDGLIDIIATDHAPHLPEEKDKSYWEAVAGVPGVEFALPLMLNNVNRGRLMLSDVVRLMCETPAELFSVANKGFLKEGFDADIAVVDMDMVDEVRNSNVVSKCGWTPYAGMLLRGWPIMTFIGGELVVEGRKIVSGAVGREVELV